MQTNEQKTTATVLFFEGKLKRLDFLEQLFRLAAEHELWGDLYWNKELEFSIICNDVFAPGSDCEMIETDADLELLEKAVIDGGIDGVLLYCARRRGSKIPERNKKYIEEKNWALFEACEGEDTPLGPDKYIVDISKPPIFPPNRRIAHSFFGGEKETQESIDQHAKWENYMEEFRVEMEKTKKEIITDTDRIDALIYLMGDWQDGSCGGVNVCLDDATHDYVLRAGTKTYYDLSFRQVLDEIVRMKRDEK